LDLDQAIDIARRAHAGQYDQAGRPYVEHVLRVVNAVATSDQKMAAALHDVLEDTSYASGDLAAAGCPPHVLDAVEALTRRQDEDYEDFVRRASANPIARAVKIADVRDNSDESRLALLAASKASQLRIKYRRASRILERGPCE
jgi:(p)ppGpp synthase/HD superfamily hydrolase